MKLLVEYSRLFNPPVIRALCAIDFSEKVIAPVSIDTVNLQHARITPAPIYPAHNLPDDLPIHCPITVEDAQLLHLLAGKDMHIWVPHVIHHALGSSPLPTVETQFTDTSEPLQVRYLLKRDTRVITKTGVQHE